MRFTLTDFSQDTSRHVTAIGVDQGATADMHASHLQQSPALHGRLELKLDSSCSSAQLARHSSPAFTDIVYTFYKLSLTALSLWCQHLSSLARQCSNLPGPMRAEQSGPLAISPTASTDVPTGTRAEPSRRHPIKQIKPGNYRADCQAILGESVALRAC